jgi:cobalt-zinc-cadmium resistance protein CzcA
LNVGDVSNVIQAAIGGQAVTQVLEGDRRFDLVVCWLPQYRQSLEAIRELRISIPSGGFVPLAQVADVRTAEGVSFVYREQLERYVPLRFAVGGRDLASAVEEAKQRVSREARLPEGVHPQWAGEYGELQQATRRLLVIVLARATDHRRSALRGDGFTDRHVCHHGADSRSVLGRCPRAGRDPNSL